jgi:hypothetical protein
MARRNIISRSPGAVRTAEGFLRRIQQRWVGLALGALACVGVILAVAGDKAEAVFGTFLYGALVVPVVVAAGMLGLLITEPFAKRGLFEESPWPAGFRLVTATALGLGALSLMTLLMGTVHLVEPGGNTWPLLLAPGAAAVAGYGATKQFMAGLKRGILLDKARKGEWLLLLSAVPVAVLLIAATFPPGSLWQSEANGYDVLEYHLEMPREYALNNSTAPVGHNVYSVLPMNMEMLYLLLMQFAKTVLGGDRGVGYVWATYPAQFCHAIMMLLAAAGVALFPMGAGARKPPSEQSTGGGASDANMAWLGATGRAVAVLLFLGVPWTIVTGSEAYNEAGMMLYGTLALGLAWSAGAGQEATEEGRQGVWMRGVLVGLLLGLAVGCKMTAGVFFALPVVLVYVVRGVGDKRHWRGLVAAAGVAAAVYLPWAVRAAVYSGGNPVFPVAAGMLPRDGWTAEQAARFAKGHSPLASQRSADARVRELVRQSVLDGQWSLQPYPVLHELMAGKEGGEANINAWWKGVGLMWFAVPLALAGAFITRAGRRDAWLLVAVAGLQVVAWMATTHLLGRFLLAAAVPLALLVGRGVQGLRTQREVVGVTGLRIVAGTIVALHALAAGLVLLPEAGLMGGVLLQEGRSAKAPIGELFFGMNNVAAAVENRGRATAEPVEPEKVLLLGEARAWLFVGPVEYYTVFDTNEPLELLRQDPQKLAAWLRERGVKYVWVNWSELARLNDTYGLDLEVPREGTWMEKVPGLVERYGPGLREAGLEDTQVSPTGLVTVYRVAGR